MKISTLITPREQLLLLLGYIVGASVHEPITIMVGL